MANFENVDVSPNFKRLRQAFIRQVAEQMQEYINEHPIESDEFLEGQDVTKKVAVELFNDFLLYSNGGEELTVKVTE